MKAGVQNPVYATIGAGVVNCAFTIVSVSSFLIKVFFCEFSVPKCTVLLCNEVYPYYSSTCNPRANEIAT